MHLLEDVPTSSPLPPNHFPQTKQSSWFPSPPIHPQPLPPFTPITNGTSFQEQMLLLPQVPPTNPPDEGAKVIMQSRTRKFPYAKGELVTTEG